MPQAHGNVLEIGIGSGLNLPFYSSTVHHVYGVDPSLELQRMALKRASGKSSEVTFLPQSAEDRIPLADLSMDTIVMTWSLCSIPNPAAALQQMKRVLKRNGQLIFIEHGCSADAGVRVWQDRITPIWKRRNANATRLLASRANAASNANLPLGMGISGTRKSYARRAGLYSPCVFSPSPLRCWHN